MRYPPLHVGDLIFMYAIEHIMGVVVRERRTGVFDVHIFRDNNTFTFPRAMLVKLETDTFCP